MLGEVFYILLFESVIGGIFTLVSLFISRVLHCALPLWVPIGGLALYCIPFLAPGVFLISPERQVWTDGFTAASIVWLCGAAAIFLWDSLRLLLAHRAVRSAQPCEDARLLSLYAQCAGEVGLKKLPPLYWSRLNAPVCVTGAVRPAVFLREDMAVQLTDGELRAVFFHELTHIRRRHTLLQRICRYICICHWLNPFVWLAGEELALHCETDCDAHALAALSGRLSRQDYASAVIRLLELSARAAGAAAPGPGAVRFLLTRRRLRRILSGPSRIRTGLLGTAPAVFLALAVAFSMWFSRQHFYPYPAYSVGTEYAESAAPGTVDFVCFINLQM